MAGPDPLSIPAALYRSFVEETAAESPCFADWAARAAADPPVLTWIADLPPAKQQPNLVFAAARLHGVPAPGPYDALRDALLSDADAIRSTILTRSTQTNEVGRLATLLPAFALVQARAAAPLGLIEVGASAGLCLYPDAYDYSWPPVGQLRAGHQHTLTARAAGPMPVPVAPVEVAWRSGIDLNPLDVRADEDMRWLETLVWPEQHDRGDRLRTAITIARRQPPRLVRGDLIDALEEEVRLARPAGRPVVFHSAVIAYLADPDRRRFSRLMRRLVEADLCDWISNEGQRVLPAVTRTAEAAGRPDERFVLGLNGRALARTHGHGASLTWIAS